MDNLLVRSSPHISHNDSVPKVMYSVVAALLPVTIASIYFFGIRALFIMVITIFSSVATEFAFQKIRNKKVTLIDGSAAVTGLLLALTLPGTIPLWMAAIGGIIAIGLGKQVYGGLGSNIFNPALVGRAFLLITFPVAMTNWGSVDGVSIATPLNLLKMQGQTTEVFQLLTGNVSGSIGETSAVAIMIGAGILLYLKLIDWRIPTAFIGVTIIFTLVFRGNPLVHILSGGLLLGAFFMATDMVTTPLSKSGKWIFGAGCGLLTAVIRLYGGYPEGVMFSILLMNAFTPAINRYCKPRMFGRVKLNEKSI